MIGSAYQKAGEVGEPCDHTGDYSCIPRMCDLQEEANSACLNEARAVNYQIFYQER